MKGKLIKYTIIAIVLVLGLARVSGALRFFTISSFATEPNLKYQKRMVGTNLLTPKRLDFVYFERDDELFGNHIIIQRLVALPGDVLQCKDDVLYVNGKNIDNTINLRRFYKFQKEEYEKEIKALVNNDETISTLQLGNDSIAVTLDEEYVKNSGLKAEIFKQKLDRNSLTNDLRANNLGDNGWTFNNFGPITLPKDKYFFVGDNRERSMDSRYLGFVNQEYIKGTLLFQF